MSSGKRKTVVQFSDSSSDSDREEDHTGSGSKKTQSLSKEMALAAQKLREKNPHAEQGRATLPRTNPLERRVVPTDGKPKVGSASASAMPKGKKMDLFADSSSSSSSSASDHDDEDRTSHRQMRSKDKALPLSDSHDDEKKASKAETSSDDDQDIKSDDGGAFDESSGLHINKKYAQKYEEVKRKQELQRLTEKYGKKLESIKKTIKKTRRAGGGGGDADGSGSDSSEGDEDQDEDEDDSSSSGGEPEDDEAVLLTEENELAFAQALLAVRKAAAKAEKLKQKGLPASGSKDSGNRNGDDDDDEDEDEAYLKQRYFPPVEEQIKYNTEIYEKALKNKAKNKKFTLREEYQRAVHATAAAADDGDGAEDEPEDNGSGLRKLRPQTAEERALRKAFLQSVADSTDAFAVTKKEEQEGRQQPEESEESKARHLEEQRRKLMEEAFSKGSSGNSKADEDELFIRQFFMNDLWRGGKKGDGSSSDDEDEDDNGEGNHYAKTLAELAQAEEDEAFFNDVDAWEREYQEKKYRHEEEAEAAQIQTFPRPIGEAAAGLLRKTSDTRKDARKRKKDRIEAARQQQLEELKRLKHLKRMEIEEQRALIAAVAGIASNNKKLKQEQEEAARKKKSKKGADDDDDDLEKPTWSDDDADEDEALRKLKAVWTDKDLEAPFDPEEFDKKMAQLFNEDYYAPENVNEDEIAYMEAELDNDGDEDGANDIPAQYRASGNEEADEDDDDDDDDDENGDEDEDAGATGTGNTASSKKAAKRAKFAALAEEPDLFKASSLEEAKKLAVTTNVHDSARSIANEDGLFFSDPFGPTSSSTTSAQKKKKAATHPDDGNDDDDLALLYPSASLHHLEEASFKQRQELDRLLDEHRKLHGDGDGATAAQNAADAKTGGEDEDEESEEAVLKRLQAELKRKEEEYYQLHHDGTTASGEPKMRFRYREVEPEDFTLSIEEILARDDRQLNMIAPMNCYAAYLDKEANLRDRRRIERRRMKGFREIETDRKSRRYGEVGKTVVLNPEEITAEEGEEITQRLRKRLREEGVDVDHQNPGARARDGEEGGRHPRGGIGGGGATWNGQPSFKRGRGDDYGGRGGRGRGSGGNFPRGGGSGGGRGFHGDGNHRGGRGGRGGFPRGGRGFAPRGRGGEATRRGHR